MVTVPLLRTAPFDEGTAMSETTLRPLLFKSTTVTLEVALVLLTVSAKWRRLSTATLVGEVPTEIGLPIFCRYVGLEGSRSISEIELEAVFATTAIPVDVSIATELGLLPTP